MNKEKRINKRTSKASQKEFELAILLLNKGLKTKEISELVGFAPATINCWKKYETWDSYCEYKKIEAEKKRIKETQKINQVKTEREFSEPKISEIPTKDTEIILLLQQIAKDINKLVMYEEEKRTWKQQNQARRKAFWDFMKSPKEL